MIKPGIYISVLFWFVSSFSNAQRVQDWLLLGDKAVDEKDYYGALLYYQNAFDIDSNKAEVNYKYAEALRYNNRYEQSAYYYNKIFRKEMGRLFPEGPFWLAMMQKQAGNYAKSKSTWRIVQKMHSEDPASFQYKKAIQEIRACDIAQKLMETTKEVKVDLISDKINTDQSEFAAVLDVDSSLYFSSLRGDYTDKGEVISENYFTGIYKSEKAISAPEELEFLINEEDKHIGNLSFSSDGKMIFFSVCDGYSHCNLWTADFKNGEISNPQELNILNDPFASTSQPWFSEIAGEQFLFFASNREGSFGGFDIWYSKMESGQFLNAINAGREINSIGNEVSPFYDSQNNVLYFSSDWHYGLGGYDIFKSEGEPPLFSIPENQGPPFNSAANDLYFNLNYELETGLLSSNRSSKTQSKTAACCNDIYRFDLDSFEKADSLPKIKTIEQLNDYLPVALYFHNDEPDPKTRATKTNKNYLETYYSYLQLLPEYEEKYAEGISDDEINKAKDAIDDFFLNKVDEGVKNLQLFSRLLAQELQEGEQIDMTIKGYASPLAKTEYNVALTKRRISSLINYFKTYDNEALLPYLNHTAGNGGKLNFIEIPFGEYTADTFISDNPNDVENSIYSIAAASERKIEIISVHKSLKDSLIAEMSFSTELIDLGAVRNSAEADFEFEVINSGNSALVIDSITTTCDCISINSGSDSIAAGESKTLVGMLNPANMNGKNIFVLRVFSNADPAIRELTLTLEVIEEE